MRLLLDTHTFLWFAEDNSALSADARRLIEDADNDILLSVASLWEIAIKFSIGKLGLKNSRQDPQPFDPFVTEELRINRISPLPIEMPHIVRVSQLPMHHRDPFDRMLAAQSLVEDLPVLSVDAALDAYGVRRLW